MIYQKNIIASALAIVISGTSSTTYAASLTIDNSLDRTILIDRNTISKNGFRVDATIKIIKKKVPVADQSNAGVAMVDIEADCISKDWIIEATALYESVNAPFSISSPDQPVKEAYQLILENQKIKGKIIRNLCRELY